MVAETEPPNLALWGPTAAGKTMLVAQLILAQQEASADWDVLPTKDSLMPIQEMRATIVGRNAFLKATNKGEEQQLSYRFRHRKTGRGALLSVEDRRGSDWEELEDDAITRLKQARGIVLLFDATRSQVQIEHEVASTLDKLYVDLGEAGRDPRPVAVCLSKADTKIHSPEDYARATTPSTMHEFAASFLDARVLRTLDRHLASYRLFPISAAGVGVQYGIVEHFAFRDESLDLRLRTGGTPINLFEPFLWLIETLEGS